MCKTVIKNTADTFLELINEVTITLTEEVKVTDRNDTGYKYFYEMFIGL